MSYEKADLNTITLWDFNIFLAVMREICIFFFFEKHVRIKIEEHKILVLMSEVHGNRMKLTQVTAVNWDCKPRVITYRLLKCTKSWQERGRNN